MQDSVCDDDEYLYLYQLERVLALVLCDDEYLHQLETVLVRDYVCDDEYLNRLETVLVLVLDLL